MMLRFRRLENFLSPSISVYLYVIFAAQNFGFRPETIGNRVPSKSSGVTFIHTHFSPSVEIVPHLQRELVV